MYERYNEYYDEPIETRHIYVLTEEEYQEYIAPFPLWSFLKGVFCVVGLLLFLAPSSSRDISPYELSVPVQALPPQSLIATVAIQQSGLQTIPATEAHGMLTIRNGSILAQYLSAGFIATTSSGVEIVIGTAVTIPASDGISFGVASVSAHAVVPGRAGNIGALAINQVYQVSLFIKNLGAFSGGSDSYTVPVATTEDKDYALQQARYRLHRQIANRLTNGMPKESVMWSNSFVIVQWECQFVIYAVPKWVKVMGVRRDGMNIILEIKR